MIVRNVFGGLLLLALAACGGSDNDDPDVDPDPPVNPGDGITLVSGFTGDIDYTIVFPEQGIGVGADGSGGLAIGSTIGTIRNATVTVYNLADGSQLGQASTGLSGLTTLTLPSDYTDGVIVQLLGTATSDYYDVALNEFRTFPEGYQFRAYVPEITGNIGVGPGTEIIVNRLVNELTNASGAQTEAPAKTGSAATGRASELNTANYPQAETLYRSTRHSVQNMFDGATNPRLVAGSSANVTIVDVVASRPVDWRPVQLPHTSSPPPSAETERFSMVSPIGFLTRAYSDIRPESGMPVLDLSSGLRIDFADGSFDLKQGTQPIDDTAYQQAMTLQLEYNISNSFELQNVRYAASEPDQLISYPSSSHTLITGLEAEQQAFQLLATTARRLHAQEIFTDGSIGDEFLLTDNVGKITTGIPGFEVAVQPANDLRMVYFFGDNINFHLGDIAPNQVVNGIERRDLQFSEPVTGIYRQNNHTLVTTANSLNTGTLKIFGRGGVGSLLEELGIPDTPASQPVDVSFAALFESIGATEEPFLLSSLWADPLGDTLLAINREAVLFNSTRPESLDLSDFFTGTNRGFHIAAQTSDTLAIHDNESLVMLDYTNSPLTQGCSAGLAVAGAPFQLFTTVNAAFGGLIISDVVFAGDFMYFTTIDLGNNHKTQLWSCGSDLEPTLLLETIDSIKLYVSQIGRADVAFAGVTPGPMPENGHTIFALSGGAMLSALDLPSEPETMTINANNFTYSTQKRRLVTINLPTGPTEVEYVSYTFLNAADKQGIMVHTRSDLDPDGGEGVFQVEFYNNESISVGADATVNWWSMNAPPLIKSAFPSDVLGDPKLQVTLADADVFGDLIELENLPLKISYYPDKRVEIDGFLNLPN